MNAPFKVGDRVRILAGALYPGVYTVTSVDEGIGFWRIMVSGCNFWIGADQVRHHIEGTDT